jgi:hypothetical protein
MESSNTSIYSLKALVPSSSVHPYHLFPLLAYSFTLKMAGAGSCEMLLAKCHSTDVTFPSEEGNFSQFYATFVLSQFKGV